MNKKNTILKDALILCIITVIAGFALGYIYDLTKEPIKKAEENAKIEAYKKVFKGAEKFYPYTNIDKDFLSENGFENISINEIVYACGEKNEKSNLSKTAEITIDGKKESIDYQGFVVTVTSGNGYAGDITLTVGIDNSKKINGIAFLKINETAGLGAKAAETEFTNQFSNKKVNEFIYTKMGAKNNNEIDSLTGATITTAAVTDSVNGAIEYVFEVLAKE